MNDNFDARNVNESWKDDEELLKQNMILLEDESVQALFNGYYYDSEAGSTTGVEPLPKEGSITPSSQPTVDSSNRK